MAASSLVSVRETCRSCAAEDLSPILSLGSQYVSDFVDGDDLSRSVKAPLELVLCRMDSGGCGLLQLRHTVAPDLLYGHYWYKSMVNDSMMRALADVCRSAERCVQLSAGDLVLDIGCNDGTLLRSYGVPDLVLAGFDPASNLMEDARVGTTRVINDFFGYETFRSAFPDAKAKVITSIAMFYDLERPNDFVEDIVKCLDQDGIWIVQMSYLPSMLAANAFDNICHEHLEYYSLMAIQRLLEPRGLEIVDVGMNAVNGGSIRLFVRHLGRGPVPAGGPRRVEDTLDSERGLGLQSRDVYDRFAGRVNAIKQTVVQLIAEETDKGKSVYVYGASTKGNTLLQYFGLDSTVLKAAAERNPDKWGKKTVGTMIPIISENQARADNPDYFLVLPWHFLEGFVERERDFLKRGGKFIVPLPEFQVVGDEDL